MTNRLCEIIGLKTYPVAVYRQDALPEDAKIPNGHCTIPSLFVYCARKGRKTASDSAHSPCRGSKSGFGFGGISNRRNSSWSLSVVPEEEREGMKHQGSGQSLFKNPEIALTQLDPIKDYGDGNDVIVFQDADEAEKENRPIEVVIFLADPVSLSALIQLASYSKTTPGPAAVMPYGHGCQQIYAIPRAEGESGDPHAVIGMTDMYARRFIRPGELSFAVPYKLYKRMMIDIDGSFLQKEKYLENLRRSRRAEPE